MPIEIRKTTPKSPGRPCKWSLGLQDDSVFADFDMDADGRVFLIRISFDGYGCCETDGVASSMSLEISRRWISLVDAAGIRSPEMQSMLSEYLRQNSDVIWKDALEEYRLI